MGTTASTLAPEPASSATRSRTIDGGPGDDVLRMPDGAGGEIDGGEGDDRITGGRGRDEIYGENGDDVIDVRDDAGDTVDCGPGLDRVRADRRDVLRGCEIVRRR